LLGFSGIKGRVEGDTTEKSPTNISEWRSIDDCTSRA
jgi:hypothetical protein